MLKWLIYSQTTTFFCDLMYKVQFGPVWEPREVSQCWALRSVTKTTPSITLFIKMPNQECMRLIITIMAVLQHFRIPDVEIWQQVLQMLTEVIRMLQEELDGYGPEESSSEEELE